MAATAPADEAYWIVSAAVDQAFYRATYHELDVPGFDPIRHYVEEGWRQGRDPAPWFSVRSYLRLYPDVELSGEDPLVHYLTKGAREGRAVAPSEHAARFRITAEPPWRFAPPPTLRSP